MVPLALVAIWIGGALYDGLILGAAAGLAMEWGGLCRGGPACHRRVAGGVAWIALAAAAALWLRADPLVGRANIGFLVVVVWASDIGAYLVGRTLGGPKLAPAISPGKTWAGAAGGLVGAALLGVGIALVHGLRHPGPPCLARAAGLAVAVSVVGQAGDLAESWAKRRSGGAAVSRSTVWVPTLPVEPSRVTLRGGFIATALPQLHATWPARPPGAAPPAPRPAGPAARHGQG